jgi:hypothetical protein
MQGITPMSETSIYQQNTSPFLEPETASGMGNFFLHSYVSPAYSQ